MALSGFVGIPIAVNVQMASVIHDTYTVKFEAPAFTTLDHDSFTFNNGNWSTNQVLTVTCLAAGECKIPVKISAPYNPTGDLDSSITLDIEPLPLDQWTGSMPGFTVGGDHGGSLQISHRALDTIHSANVAIAPHSGRLNAAGFVSHQAIVRVKKPDGTHVNLNNANNTGIAMDQIGVWTFQVAAEAATIMESSVGQFSIQDSQWTFSTTDGVTGVVSAVIKHQGGSWVAPSALPIVPNGAYTLNALVLDEAINNPVLIAGTITTELNSTGGHFVGGGSSLDIAGTRINAPSGMSASGSDVTIAIGGTVYSTITVGVSAV